MSPVVTSDRPRVLIAGYGDLGRAVSTTLLEDGLEVAALRRSGHSQQDGVSLFRGDVTRPETLAALATIDPDILLYCVAADSQSDAHYRAQYVEGLRHVLAALTDSRGLRHVFFVSSTRVYGQATEALLSEEDPAVPADFGGERLLEAERLLDGLTCGHTALRLSGIYGPGRNRMIQLAASPDLWPAQNAWTNRIHRDDAAGFIVFLIRQVLRGQPPADCYIVTDSCPCPQYEVLQWLADRSGAGHAPATEPQGGKRLSNRRMLQTGFRLAYPDYRTGYAALLNKTNP